MFYFVSFYAQEKNVPARIFVFIRARIATYNRPRENVINYDALQSRAAIK